MGTLSREVKYEQSGEMKYEKYEQSLSFIVELFIKWVHFQRRWSMRSMSNLFPFIVEICFSNGYTFREDEVWAIFFSVYNRAVLKWVHFQGRWSMRNLFFHLGQGFFNWVHFQERWSMSNLFLFLVGPFRMGTFWGEVSHEQNLFRQEYFFFLNEYTFKGR